MSKVSPRCRSVLAAALVLATLSPLSPATVTVKAQEGPELIPLRAVAEAAGAQVEWIGAANTAVVTRGETTLSVRIGESSATLNGEAIPLGQAVQLVGGRTMVPLSLLARALRSENLLNVMVQYDPEMENRLFRPDWADEYGANVQKEFDYSRCPGRSVGLAKDGAPIYLESFGYRDCEVHLPMTTDTTMGVGSVNKVVTAVAIMQLQEDGKLSVNDPVIKYLPTYRTPNPEYAAKTTIHHLLTHTSGLGALPFSFSPAARSIAQDPDAPPDMKNLKPLDTAEQLMEAIAEFPMKVAGTPGKYYSYSNEGYALLGEIVQRVSGQSYEAYVTEQILKPAGMVHSTFDEQTLQTFPRVATLYSPVPSTSNPALMEPKRTPFWWDLGVMTPAGGLKSTVQDLLRFAEIFRTQGLVGENRLLSKESVEAMTHPWIEADYGYHYGYGLGVRPDYHGMVLLEHGGSAKGASAMLMVVPEKGLTAVSLTNMVRMERNLLGAINLAAGLPIEAKAKVYPPYPKSLERPERYAGTYQGDNPVVVKVDEQGGLLFELAGMSLPAWPVAKNVMGFDLFGELVTVPFFMDESGNAFSLRFGHRIYVK